MAGDTSKPGMWVNGEWRYVCDTPEALKAWPELGRFDAWYEARWHLQEETSPKIAAERKAWLAHYYAVMDERAGKRRS